MFSQFWHSLVRVKILEYVWRNSTSKLTDFNESIQIFSKSLCTQVFVKRHSVHLYPPCFLNYFQCHKKSMLAKIYSKKLNLEWVWNIILIPVKISIMKCFFYHLTDLVEFFLLPVHYNCNRIQNWYYSSSYAAITFFLVDLHHTLLRIM